MDNLGEKRLPCDSLPFQDICTRLAVTASGAFRSISTVLVGKYSYSGRDRDVSARRFACNDALCGEEA